jgi:hypothetical protein
MRHHPQGVDYRVILGIRSAGAHVGKAGKEEEERKQAIFPARTTRAFGNCFDAPVAHATKSTKNLVDE